MSYQWTHEQKLRARVDQAAFGTATRAARSIRLRNMVIAGEPRNVTVRLVETSQKIQAACELINDRYSWRGYGASHHIPEDAQHITFTAEIDEEVVGTITLAIDSPAGLAVDNAFQSEIDEVRNLPGTRVCELTKFAFSPEVHSKELMAALFHIVFVYGSRTYGGTDLFIEVNPRHVRFYEAMLGFKRVGALKENESVAAPAQLMCLKVSEIREQIELSGGLHTHNSRSLYPFFFSPTEEDGIYGRLVHADREVTPFPATTQCPFARSEPRRGFETWKKPAMAAFAVTASP